MQTALGLDSTERWKGCGLGSEQAQAEGQAAKAREAQFQSALQELTLFKSRTSAALLQVRGEAGSVSPPLNPRLCVWPELPLLAVLKAAGVPCGPCCLQPFWHPAFCHCTCWDQQFGSADAAGDMQGMTALYNGSVLQGWQE